jgi:hypothetical protein
MIGRFLYLLGLTVSVVPPALAALSYFPIWQERGSGAVVSGFTLLLLLIAIIPILKSIKRLLSSAASYTVWLFIYLLFMLMASIADEMTVISLVGFISNIIGAVLFKLSERGK